MRIAFINVNDPHDKCSRSGIPYSIFHQLEREYEVIWIKSSIIGFYPMLLHFFIRVYEKITRWLGYSCFLNPYRSRIKAYCLKKQLNKVHYDAVFSTDSEDIAYLDIDKPIFYRTDALAHLMIDYYYFNIPQHAQSWAKRVEENAIANSSILFAPSSWVIDGIKSNNIDTGKCKIVLLETGANLYPDKIEFRKRDFSLDIPLRLLFVGFDLKRKGIDVAYKALDTLNSKYAVNSTLTIIGGEPDVNLRSDDRVKYAGRLDKNDPEESRRFYEEFYKADIFIFPTKAECHGIVNCEASAYGLPIYSYNTGGVSTYCIDGLNGRTLNMSAVGEDFAESIYRDLKSGKLSSFSEQSRLLFEKKFNWNAWGNKALPLITEIVSKGIK